VREARDEAKKEIEQYKANKEAEFKKFEAEVLRPSLVHCCDWIGTMLTVASTHKATRRPRRKPTGRPRRQSKRSRRLGRRARIRLSTIFSQPCGTPIQRPSLEAAAVSNNG
jgi:hypothetical protein